MQLHRLRADIRASTQPRQPVKSIGQARRIHDNIKKSIHFLVSTNLSEILVMFTAVAAGLGQPLNGMQLLWINLMSDIAPALALALEPPEPDQVGQSVTAPLADERGLLS